MNILIAKKDMSTMKSAATGIVLEEARYFTDRGHHVRIIAEAMDRDAIIKSGAEPIKTLKWPISGWFRRRFFQLMVERYLKKHPADLVIGSGDILRQDILFMHNCVHLAHERIYGEPLPASNDVGRIHTTLLTEGSFDLLLCNSAMMRDDLVKRFGIDTAKTTIFCPGVDLSKFEATDAEREAIRQETRRELNISEQAIVIGLITSGDFKKRNVDGMIKAFAVLADKFPLAQLLVAGKDRLAPYKTLAEDLHVSDKVIFAPAIAEVKRYYFASDIFVLPAHIEEFGRSIAEAMYCGLPVVVSPWAGAADILEGESRNYILPDAEVASIADIMEGLLSNSTAWEHLGALNRTTAAKYTKEASLERLYELALHCLSVNQSPI